MRAVIAGTVRLKDHAECERLSPLLRALAECASPRRAFVEIIFVGERRMASLNRVYKGRAGAAEILTFHYGRGLHGEGENPLGEIYLCWARLCRGAERRGVSRRAYAARLLAHGLFHLSGWRHDTEQSEARMEAAERKFLEGRFSQRVLGRLFA